MFSAKSYEEPRLLKVTYIGHGTTLIESGGQCFLTDPNFSDRILTFKRRQAPGLDPRQLPELSAILVSHAHYDHLDLFSYKFFKVNVPLLCPKGLGKFIRKFLPNPVVEIPPWSHHRHQGVEIHLVPVKHHGFRWLPFRNRAAGAFVLKSAAGTVYFAGDTGPGEHFKETASLFEIDLALLPIGGYHPAWMHKKSKLNPEKALEAFTQLRAKHLIPIGWGTFDFFGEKPEAAKEELSKLIAEKKLEAQVHLLIPGQSFTLGN